MRVAPVGLAYRSAHSVPQVLWHSGHMCAFCVRTSVSQACVIVPLALLVDQQRIALSLKLGLTYTNALPGTRGACFV